MTERLSDAEYADSLEWAKAVLSVLSNDGQITLANVSVKVRAVDEITHARALLRADQDAARYRWLRRNAESVAGLNLEWFTVNTYAEDDSETYPNGVDDPTFDAAIDAAMKEQP